MKKILFVGYNLQTGGVQTALINTLKEISENFTNYQVDLFLFAGGELENEIPQEVKVYKGNYLLNLVATPFSEVIKGKRIYDVIIRLMMTIFVRIIGSKNFFSYLFKMHKMDEKYDIAISYFNDVPNNKFNQGCNKFVLENIKSNKRVAWIHTDPIKARFDKEYCRDLYKEFDAIVNVSNACKEKFDIFLPEFRYKSFVVYNFFPTNEINIKADSYVPFNNINDKITFVTVARIDNFTKRIDKIIEICKLLKDNNLENFRWYIVGDGPDLEVNKELAMQYQVSEFLEFVGTKLNPFPYIKNADFLVVTSDYEGYPMVVGESVSLKTPVIITNYAAAHEQIKEGYQGLISEMDSYSIYKVLRGLLINPNGASVLRDNLLDSTFSNDTAREQLSIIFE